MDQNYEDDNNHNDEHNQHNFKFQVKFEKEDFHNTIEEIVQVKTSTTIRDLQNFIEKGEFLTEKRNAETNVINQGEKKTYKIPLLNMEEFFTLLNNCRKDKRMLHWSEKQAQYSGILIDFDRYQKSKSRQINDKHLHKLAAKIVMLLYEFLDLSLYIKNGEIDIKVFVIQKPDVVLDKEKGLYKDGFHILIPEIMVTKGLKDHLNKELVKRNAIKACFNDIEHIGDPNDMLDMNSKHVPVLYLGNSKCNRIAYNFTKAFTVLINIYDETTPSSVHELYVDELEKTYNMCYELSLSTYLETFDDKPVFLYKRHVQYKPELDTKIQLEVEKNRGRINQDELDETEDSVNMLTLPDAEAKYLQQLLELLDLSYAEEYDKWRNVVWALANTSQQYKPLAIWFSHRGSKLWSKQALDDIWAQAGTPNKEPITKRSIVYWARMCNQAKFLEIYNQSYHQRLMKAVLENDGSITHGDIAIILKSMLGDKFIVDICKPEAPGQKETYYWYEFVLPEQQHKKGEVFKWRKEFHPDNIHLFIYDHLPKVYSNVMTKLKELKDGADSEEKTKWYVNVMKSFKNCKKQLGDNGYQNSAITQGQYRFRHRGFCDALDKDEDIIGVGNGLLKLLPQPHLIKSFHEYRISKFTETDYLPYDPNNPMIQLVEKAWKDIFIEPDVYEKIMMSISTAVDKRPAQPFLYMFIGGGRNGKTSFMEQLLGAIGLQYGWKSSLQLLVDPFQKANAANSAHHAHKGKTFIYYDEAEQSEVLNMKRVKDITAPNQNVRGNYRDQENITSTSLHFALSNFEFIVETTDHGSWRRLIYYKVKVKFCSNPDPNNPFEKKGDKNFIDVYPKDPEYRRAVLSILVHWNEILFNKYGYDLERVVSKTLDQETEAFRNRNDMINRFISQMMLETTEGHEYSLTSVAEKYVNWHNRFVRGFTPNIDQIVEQFENSKLHSFIILKDNKKYVLTGHTIMDSPDEVLELENNINAARKEVNAEELRVMKEERDKAIARKNKLLEEQIIADKLNEENLKLTVTNTVQESKQATAEFLNEYGVTNDELEPKKIKPLPDNGQLLVNLLDDIT